MTLVSILVAILLVAPLTVQQKLPPTNDEVVKMVRAGLAETTIVNVIAGNETQFDLSANGLQTLNQARSAAK
jgi:hypothetical protein